MMPNLSETPQEKADRLARWDRVNATNRIEAQRQANDKARRAQSELTQFEAEYLLGIARDVVDRDTDRVQGGQ